MMKIQKYKYVSRGALFGHVPFVKIVFVLLALPERRV